MGMNLKILYLFSSFFFLVSFYSIAQTGRWQQRVEYQMEVEMDVNSHQFFGRQHLVYYNNSPDTLHKVYYHLFLNAFQPNSMMDVRSRTIADPDTRVASRIQHLGPDEIGYQNVKKLKQDGKSVKFEEDGTILVVLLAKPILPNSKTVLEMEFQAQVPLQIRRTGRHNAEGIAYSMAQWFPKMVEYDYEGWHANPYVGREFHGVWGDFDVKITIDSAYTVAGTGYLQNAHEIGHGYTDGEVKPKVKKGKLTWHFKATDVHDFVWAADPNYIHVTAQVPNGPLLRFFYVPDSLTTTNWSRLPEYTIKSFEFMNAHYGQYPYGEYAIIQGGDGGMEYPMATLITGHRSFVSLVGVTVHELVHSWYQMLLASNETIYHWMDEGFTTYASNIIMGRLFNLADEPHASTYRAYFSIVKAGLEEPMSLHADFYNTNRGYGIAAYYKGAIFLHQLGYVIGEEALQRGLLRYFNTWKYKHPNPTDFKRVMEREAEMELDWYFQQWVNTTRTIDYGIKSVIDTKDTTFVTLERKGLMPMPIEVEVTYQDGHKVQYYAPLKIMRGEKPQEDKDIERIVLEDWPWTHPEYVMAIPKRSSPITYMEIDPSQRMADVDRDNNSVDLRSYKTQ